MNNISSSIAQVAIKKSSIDYEVITLIQFLKIELAKRTQMIMQREVEFVDFNGETIPLGMALKEITAMIKSLRGEGRIGEILSDEKKSA